MGQMIKSLISSRTHDEVSLLAYRRLAQRWKSASRLALASVAEIEAVIHDVTFADVKSAHLAAALRMIADDRPDYCLEFLGDMPVGDALAWLECLPGVGRKVAAATLNASTLCRPVFIVDCHVHRVLQRLGFVAPNASAVHASEAVTASGLDAAALHELFVHMKQLGQTLCRFEEVHCHACPLSTRCRTAASPISAFPRRAKSLMRVYPRGSAVALERRRSAATR